MNNDPKSYAGQTVSRTADFNAVSVPEQNSAYAHENVQMLPYDGSSQYPYYSPVADQSSYTDVLGILSVIFSSVGLLCCGVQFSLISIVTGIIAMVKAKRISQKSSMGLVGVILGCVSLVLFALMIIGYFTIIVTTVSDLFKDLSK